MTNQPELLPCPICGGEAEILGFDENDPDNQDYNSRFVSIACEKLPE